MSATHEAKPFEKNSKWDGRHPNKKKNTPHPVTGKYSKYR